jgi:hypothetical protein
MTADEYEKLCKAVNEWADAQYRLRYPQWA